MVTNGYSTLKTPPPRRLEDVLACISGLRAELARRYSLRSIAVFGSITKGTADSSSDLDILVELAEPTFDNYMDLKFQLEETLGRPVDLVLRETLKPRLRQVVEKEAVYV